MIYKIKNLLNNNIYYYFYNILKTIKKKDDLFNLKNRKLPSSVDSWLVHDIVNSCVIENKLKAFRSNITSLRYRESVPAGKIWVEI